MNLSALLRCTSTESASLLQQGRVQQARKLFLSSIEGLSSSIDSGKLPQDTQDEGLPKPSCLVTARFEVSGSRPEYSMAPDNSSEFYSTCFVVVESTDNLSQSQEGGIGAALVYNVAVTFHTEFVKSGQMRSLRKATTYYRKALELWRATYSQDSHVEPIACVLRMAICNNLGHCFAHTLDGSSTSMCLNEIQYTLETHMGAIEEDSPCQGDFEHFFGGLLFYRQNFDTMLPSPAA